MKKLSVFSLLITFTRIVYSQTSTWQDVYNLLQTECASCHVAAHESGLVLSASIAEVYNNLVYVVPTNDVAAEKNYFRVKPGDPYTSFLFRKVNNGLAPDVTLSPEEGDPCPQDGLPLDNKDIELIRQWILYGAHEEGEQVEEALITDFYDNDGIQSMPSPPAAPSPEDGFQIHFGPYFLWPGTEHEYWLEYFTGLPIDEEIYRLDTYMGEYSHHFITYKFNSMLGPVLTPAGLHDGPDYLFMDLVSANQYSDSLILPEKTALTWETGTVLNLNSHYINYSPDKVLACDVYINVYTQPAGTAVQVMYPFLVSNADFWIPANNLPYTASADLYDNSSADDEVFIWAMSSHTHQLGADFDIYIRTPDGEKGEHIFDASCSSTEGIPGCITEIYDYKHPPVRVWPGMLPVKPEDGLIYETTWINDGPEPVGFGLTSEDEMMVMIYFYVSDTAGLNLPIITGIEEEKFSEDLMLFPNPASDVIYMQTNVISSNDLIVELTDITGKITSIKNYSVITGSPSVLKIQCNGLVSGIYVVRITDQNGNGFAGKVVLQ